MERSCSSYLLFLLLTGFHAGYGGASWPWSLPVFAATAERAGKFDRRAGKKSSQLQESRRGDDVSARCLCGGDICLRLGSSASDKTRAKLDVKIKINSFLFNFTFYLSIALCFSFYFLIVHVLCYPVLPPLTPDTCCSMATLHDRISTSDWPLLPLCRPSLAAGNPALLGLGFRCTSGSPVRVVNNYRNNFPVKHKCCIVDVKLRCLLCTLLPVPDFPACCCSCTYTADRQPHPVALLHSR